MKNHKFTTKVWIYPGVAAWHFVTLPQTLSKRIKTTFAGLERGFGSFPVKVCIGATSWSTSIFPDKKAGSYFLPLKAIVRKKEFIKAGQTITVSIKIEV
jgi:hypothetical protein